MSTVEEHVEHTDRQVGNRLIKAGESHFVRLERSYDHPLATVWDACTVPQQLEQWFLGLSGDFRVGGHYQLEGNAQGEIVHCEPPHRLHLTWVFGEHPKASDVSEVELRLSTAGEESTTLILEHAVVIDPTLWSAYGPGAAGVGWDMSLLALDLHLGGETIGDRAAWKDSSPIRNFITRCAGAWSVAHESAGAPKDQAERACRNTSLFYAPDHETTESEPRSTSD